MYCVRTNSFKVLNTFVRFYRKSHYDNLELTRNCTDKEIKEAFIRLSKEYHPDKNKDVKAQERFIQILEAYNVLSKRSSRNQYDRMNMHSYQPPRPTHENVYHHYTYQTSRQQRYDPFTHRNNNSNTSQEHPKSYYGVKGLNKVPNYFIIIICFSIALIGTVFQIVIIRRMYLMQRREAIEKTQLLAEELDRVRAVAKGNTNEMQTQLLLERIVAASNPTIATASLGQTLASDKK